LKSIKLILTEKNDGKFSTNSRYNYVFSLIVIHLELKLIKLWTLANRRY